jgi:hypothetical protein
VGEDTPFAVGVELRSVRYSTRQRRARKSLVRLKSRGLGGQSGRGIDAARAWESGVAGWPVCATRWAASQGRPSRRACSRARAPFLSVDGKTENCPSQASPHRRSERHRHAATASHGAASARHTLSFRRRRDSREWLEETSACCRKHAGLWGAQGGKGTNGRAEHRRQGERRIGGRWSESRAIGRRAGRRRGVGQELTGKRLDESAVSDGSPL